MHTSNFFIWFTILLELNYLNALAVNNDKDSFGHWRTKRQGNSQTCSIPNIANGQLKILNKKSSANVPGSSYLLLNVTCDHNFILYPPNINIILCVNGLWDQEIPQCIQCGQRSDDTHQTFVVNGTLSKFGEFPWHVGIYRKEPSNLHPLYICGGSIISENSILTVAHCFTDESGITKTSTEFYIAAGKYYSSFNSEKDRYAQKRKIARIDIHPRYKGYFTNYAWDIAVLIVNEPLEISNLVQPICIDWMTDFENEQLIPNNYGEIAGWGSTEIDLGAQAQELRVLKVPYIKSEKCANLVPNTFIRYITPDKFCAGYTNGSSVCGGDSGGGLVFQREENRDSRFYIRGLVSVGVQIDGRCDDYKYSTYTKVSEYLTFIRESMNNKDIPTTPLPMTTTTTEPYESSIDTSAPCITPNGEHAKCISIYKCNIFLTALQNTSSADVQKFMRDSRCGEHKEVKVCCGSTIYPLSTINSNPVTTKPIIHSNLNLLPTLGNCGRQVRLRQARIYGGNVTTLLDFPWIVRLEYGTKEKSRGFLCAGFLINDRYVLTVAHCISTANKRVIGPVFQIRLGEYNSETEIDCVNISEGTGNLPNGKTCADPPLNIEVETIIPHPLFKESPTLHDIGLIRLSKKVDYTDFIKPICLPLNGEKSLPGKRVIVAGWGRTENSQFSPVKRKAFIPIVDEEVCAKKYKESAKIELQSSHLCAGGEEGIDSCAGDTGGPLMSTLTNSRDIYAEGIISFGPHFCGGKGFPGVATRVSEYVEWILDTIKP